MRRLTVFVLSLGLLAAVTACAPQPPPIDHCAAPAAPGVDWHNCDKSGAFLEFADLTGANLSGADLTDSSIWGANLTDADLTDADLSGALVNFGDLVDANLSGANLSGTNLSGTNLMGANLFGATGTPVILAAINYDNTTCPDGTVAPVDVASCW